MLIEKYQRLLKNINASLVKMGCITVLVKSNNIIFFSHTQWLRLIQLTMLIPGSSPTNACTCTSM